MNKIEVAFFDIGGTLGTVTQGHGGSGYVLHPFRDTATVLEGLQLLGLRVGVITNVPSDMDKQSVGAMLADAGLVVFFDPAGIVTSTDAGSSKPSAEIYHYAAAALGVPAERCLFVGEDPAQVDGARAAGMQGLMRK